jgi:ribosome-associated protein
MTVRAELDDVHRWCVLAAQAAADKKATGTVILDVGEVLAITDAFVITSAPNERQVRTIVDEVEKQLKAAGGPAPIRSEGAREAQWVLLDYGDFVVHVFLDEVRAFYDLERLWSDAKRFPWEERGPVAVGSGG